MYEQYLSHLYIYLYLYLYLVLYLHHLIWPLLFTTKSCISETLISADVTFVLISAHIVLPNTPASFSLCVSPSILSASYCL